MPILSVCRRGGDDLQSAAAVWAAFDVDVEDPFEQPGPAHARCFSLGTGVIGRGSVARSGGAGTILLRNFALGAKTHGSESDVGAAGAPGPPGAP